MTSPPDFWHFNIGQILAAVMSIGGTVVTVAWWLRDQFAKRDEKLAERFDELRSAVTDKVDEHEQVDQSRHEENIKRFGDINGALNLVNYRLSQLNGENNRPQVDRH